MPPLANPRHERFAQLRVQGKPADAAYVEAGYRANSGNAVRLNGNDIIVARRNELQVLAAERTLVTIESLTAELEAARQLAMADDKGAAAAVAASLGKAKLHGLLIDRGVVNLNIKTHEQALDELSGGPALDGVAVRPRLELLDQAVTGVE